MAIVKRDDGCWHWEAEPGYKKGSCKPLQLSWAITLGIMTVCFLIPTVSVIRRMPDPMPLVRQIFLWYAAFALGITALFGLLWLPVRLGKHVYCYTAGEKSFNPGERLLTGRRFAICYNQVSSLQQIRKENAIEVRASSSPMRIYAAPEDYDAVWAFLKERCTGCSLTEERQDGQGRQIIRTNADPTRKYSNYIGWLVPVIVISLLLGCITMVVWYDRGPQIEDFTGVGKAEILSIEPLPDGINHHNRHRYTARMSIAGHTRTVSGRRSGSGGWHVGDILPVTFNWKDPTQYVIGTTPQEYIPYFHRVRTAALILLSIAAVSIFLCFRFCRIIRRIESEKSKTKR